jgi:hypothetical protein
MCNSASGSGQFRAFISSNLITLHVHYYWSAEMGDTNPPQSSVCAACGFDARLPAFDLEWGALKEVEEREKGLGDELAHNPDLAKRGPSDHPYGTPYQEIKNLVWAKKHPVYRVALEEWDRTERLVSSRVDRREKRSADLINQIFNLVGFYSVFQGVVLTAVSQVVSATTSCGSQCGKVWVPILLTLFGAVVTIVGILEKFTNLKSLEKSIDDERRIQGVGFSNHDDALISYALHLISFFLTGGMNLVYGTLARVPIILHNLVHQEYMMMVELDPNIPNLSRMLLNRIESSNSESIVYLSLHALFPSMVLLSVK